jgi:serine/threonine-protein kinase
MSEVKQLDSAKFIGTSMGNVTILRELGRGNMGIVFIGFQNSLKRQVAVKTLPKALIPNLKASEQFRDEAEIVAGLNHPNIIPIFEMGETDDVYFQVIQLVTGSDLRTIIRNLAKHPVPSKRILPFRQTVDIMVQVLEGLAFAHDEGVVHQDIKPANILMDEKTRRPLIADFGIARTAQMEYSAGGVIVGTPTYLSPEQASTQPTDCRTDVYSAGIVLFEMLAGRLPIRKEKVQDLLLRKIHSPNTFFEIPPSQASTAINTRLERIILQATAGDPDDRYPDCRIFAADLAAYRDKYLARG